jgi:hypothetical protein
LEKYKRRKQFGRAIDLDGLLSAAREQMLAAGVHLEHKLVNLATHIYNHRWMIDPIV